MIITLIVCLIVGIIIVEKKKLSGSYHKMLDDFVEDVCAEVERVENDKRKGDGMKTVYSIVKEYLIANGCDGLAGASCGCGVDDLMPCGGDNNPTDCSPAKLVDCTPESCDLNVCEGDGYDKCVDRKIYVSVYCDKRSVNEWPKNTAYH